jgi:hypothetical protein
MGIGPEELLSVGLVALGVPDALPIIIVVLLKNSRR